MGGSSEKHTTMRTMATLIIAFQLSVLVGYVAAPLPPCTPFLFVNKLVESNNWSSDMNPFYPVKPCPYANPRDAPLHLRFAIFNNPIKNLYHVATELTWFFTTGIGRAINMFLGHEPFRVNERILREGYHSHYTGANRVRHFGRNSRKTKAYYNKKRRRRRRRR